MKRKKIFTDPAFWILLGINGYLVYHYYHYPEIFKTLIWLYWSQSVMIGLFSFIDILTTPQRFYGSFLTKQISITGALDGLVDGSPLPDENKPPAKRSNFSLARGFLVPYIILHLIYLVFIASMKSKDVFRLDLYSYFLLAFLLGQIISFIQHKINQRKTHNDDGGMYALPYLRVFPMHITIVIGAFLHAGNMLVFLILKSITDVIMYIATKPKSPTREMDAATLASQQSMNI